MDFSKFIMNMGYRGREIWWVSGTCRTECHVSNFYVGKQSPEEENDSPNVLASSPIALIKSSDQSNFSESEFPVVHSSSFSAS